MLVSFDFLGRQSYLSLALTGFFYNLGVWVDKFVFWANPLVSDPVIGPLRASIIYDIPIFLAYLSIVPGMAVFLVRVETDFAESYDAFYHAVRSGDSLVNIQRLKGTLSERRPPGHGRHLQGAGRDPAGAVPDRPARPRRASASRPCTCSCSSSIWRASAPRC